MQETTETAWLAGLLEGEGTFGCYNRGPKRQSPVLCAAIMMTDKDIIERAAAMMCSSGIKVHKQAKSSLGSKPLWVTKVSGYKAQRLMQRILPHMSARRTEQITTALGYWESRPIKKREQGLPPTCHPDRKHYSNGLCKNCHYIKFNSAEAKRLLAATLP